MKWGGRKYSCYNNPAPTLDPFVCALGVQKACRRGTP